MTEAASQTLKGSGAWQEVLALGASQAGQAGQAGRAMRAIGKMGAA